MLLQIHIGIKISGIVQHEHMGYVFLRALEGICTRSPILNQLGGMLLYSSNVPFLAPTDLGGKSYMYLPQISYHPPVLCGQTTQLWSTEKQLALCIHFFFYVAGTCTCWRFMCIYSCNSSIPSGMCLLPCVHAQGVKYMQSVVSSS